jgi:hypothetical protein
LEFALDGAVCKKGSMKNQKLEPLRTRRSTKEITRRDLCVTLCPLWLMGLAGQNENPPRCSKP